MTNSGVLTEFISRLMLSNQLYHEKLLLKAVDTYEILSVRIEIQCESRQLSRHIRYVFGDFRASSDGPPDVRYIILGNKSSVSRSVYIAYRDACFRCEGDNELKFIQNMDSEIIHTVASQLSWFYIIHAGVVAIGNTAVLLPGRTGSGKSILTLGLVARGFQYLSDDVAPMVIDTMKVLPFPRAINIKKNLFELSNRGNGLHWIQIREEHLGYIRVKDINGGVIGRPSDVKYIIFPRYDPSCDPQLLKISKAQALKRLINCSFNFDAHKERGIYFLIRLVENAECHVLSANDLEKTTRLILDLIGK
jgi:hypothetical protein